MASSDNLILNLLIRADPANRQSVSDLLALQNAFNQIAKESPGILNLAKSLKITYQEADILSKSVGLTDKAIIGAANTMRALQQAGASTVTQFAALRSALTPEQFTAISAAINKTTVAIEHQVNAQNSLAQTLGTSATGADRFAKATGLSATQANQAVQRYSELSTVGQTLANKQAILNAELGLTTEQFNLVRGAALGTQQGLQGILAATGGVILGLGDIAKNAINVAVELEATLTQFAVVSSASAIQVGEVRAEVERLGTSSTKTPKEIAQLSVELAKNGLTAQQTQQSLEGIVLASQAAGEDLVGTGQLIGNIINQFQLSATDTGKIGDLLVATANSSASGVKDLGDALSYAGAQSKQSNQSLKDTLFSLGLLANAGIKGSAAGTGLAEILRRLKLASANAGTEFDDLRSRGSRLATVAFDKINTSVRTTTGEMKPLREILPAIKTNLEGFSQIDQDLIMNALFGVEGGRVANALLAGNATQIDNLSQSLENADGASKRASDTLTQSAQAGFQILAANTSVALTAVGDLLLNGVNPLIQAANLLVMGFAALPAPLQALIIGTAGFAGALAAAVAALAAFNLAQGTMIIQETIAALATVRLQGLRLAAIGTDTVATIAKSALALATTTLTAATLGASLATAKDTIVRGLNAAMVRFSTIGIGANTSALFANIIAARATISAYLGIGVVLGGVIALFQDLTSNSQAGQFTKTVADSTDAILKLKNQVAPTSEKSLFDDLGDSFNRFTTNVQSKGAIEALRSVIVDLEAAVLGGSDALSTYGDEWRIVTREQLANQATQAQLEIQFNANNQTIDTARALMDKYGVAVFNASDKTRLGASGIAAYIKESAAQISIIEASIAILAKQKAAATNDNQKNQIQTQINLLQESKDALTKRAVALTADTQALKTNTDKSKDATKALAEIKQITDAVAVGDTTASQAATSLAAIATANNKNLKVRKEASDAIIKIRKDEISAITTAVENGALTEEQALVKLAAVRASGGSEKGVAKAASAEILKIKKDQNDAEISIIQTGQAAIELLVATGKLDEADGDKQLTALKAAEIAKRIEYIQTEIAASGGSKRTKLISEEKKLNIEIETLQIEAGKRMLRRQIEAIDAATKAAQIKTLQAESLRLISTQQLINKGVISVVEGEALKAASGTQRLKEELAQNQAQATKLATIRNPSDPALLKDLESRRSAIKQAGFDLTLKLLQAETVAIAAVRDAAIKAIDVQLAARNRQFTIEAQQIETITQARMRQLKTVESATAKELAGLDITNRLLTSQSSLLGAQAGLRKAISDSNGLAGELQLNIINEELNANSGNIELLRSKADIQAAAGETRRSQLVDEQAFALSALNLSQQQAVIADRRLLLETKLIEIKAKSALLDAQAVLAQQRITDQKAIASAQAELDRAKVLAPGSDREAAIKAANLNLATAANTDAQSNALQQVDLANQQLDLSQQNTIEVGKSIAANVQILEAQRQTLILEQATALARFDGNEQLRIQIEQLGIAKALQADITKLAESQASGKPATPTAIPAFKSGGSPTVDSPFYAGESGTELVSYADGGIGMIGQPGLYQIDRPGQVISARETASLINASRLTVNVPPQYGGVMSSELRSLRQDLQRSSPAITNNSFQIVADEDPYKRMATILAGLQRVVRGR